MTTNQECNKCGLCYKDCIFRGDALKLTNDGPVIDLEKCLMCGHCVAVCPKTAVNHPKSEPQEEITQLPTYEQAVNYLRSVRSVRVYKPELIPQEQMKKLLDIGRYPQTAINTQGVSYLVLEGREKIDEFLEVFFKSAAELCPDNKDFTWLKGAAKENWENGVDKIFQGCTSAIFALTDRDSRFGRANAQYSLTFIALLAPIMGYGTCWAGVVERLACDPKYSAYINEFLKIPEDKCVSGVLMAGIPDVEYLRLVERDPLEATFI